MTERLLGLVRDLAARVITHPHRADAVAACQALKALAAAHRRRPKRREREGPVVDLPTAERIAKHRAVRACLRAEGPLAGHVLAQGGLACGGVYGILAYLAGPPSRRSRGREHRRSSEAGRRTGARAEFCQARAWDQKRAL
ncbi:hypothetical protein [Streptomyces sp. NPDC059247]|uniref:hypothetical protein n=1 Tax=Streptomyces sp. NPDC059247 TaxID=3346790 RepID=UPI003685FADF